MIIDQALNKESAMLQSESVFWSLNKDVNEDHHKQKGEDQLSLSSKTTALINIIDLASHSAFSCDKKPSHIKKGEGNAQTVNRSTSTENLNRKKETKGDAREADYVIYNFKDSGSGKSWLIGTDIYDGQASQFANAFRKGITACPEDLEIPGILTDQNGNTLPVEIIGRGAFRACGCHKTCAATGKTKRVKVPWQVKVIKSNGLASMHNLVAFEIEAGSELEIVEEYGISAIGYYTGQSSTQRTATLILPSTLSSIYANGVNRCNFFHTIIYCGSHLLSNSSTIEENVSPKTIVKVTNRYPLGQKILGRSPSRNSETETEAENICKSKGFLPGQNLLCSPLKHSSRPLIALAATLLPSRSLASHSLKTFSPSLSFFVHFT